MGYLPHHRTMKNQLPLHFVSFQSLWYIGTHAHNPFSPSNLYQIYCLTLVVHDSKLRVLQKIFGMGCSKARLS